MRSDRMLAHMVRLVLGSVVVSLTLVAQARAQAVDPLAHPWPAPVPAAPSVAPRERIDPVLLELSLRQRLGEVRSEELRLLRLDRAAQPLTRPLIGMAAGFGVTALTFVVASGLYPTDDQAGKETPAPPPLARGIIAGTAFGGLAAGFTSVGILTYRLRHRPHRAEALVLQQERKDLQRRLTDVVRQQQEGWSLTPSVSYREQSAVLRFNRRF